MKKAFWLAVVVLGLVALLSWGLRELFPKTDETEAIRLRAEVEALRDTALLNSQRADSLSGELEMTREAFEADTTAHREAIAEAVASAESVAARLRATQTEEQNARLDSVVSFYASAVTSAEANAGANAERLRQTEEALKLMAVSRDDWKEAFVKADSLAIEYEDLYRREKRRRLFNFLDFQCTAGATVIYGTKGPDIGAGITCGVGR